MTLSRLRFIPLLLLFMLLAASVACNSKHEETEQTYTPSTLAAPNAFSLKKDSTISYKLDSVFFAIDLDKGLIFNPDSLPVGTDVSALVPVISFPATMSAVTIRYTDKDGASAESNYSESPEAAINFSSPVKITVVAQDGTTTCDYTVKVNVHRQNPSLMLWSDTGTGPLPSRMPAPKESRAMTFRERSTLLIEEADGSYTLASASQPSATLWDKATVDFPFTPDLRTAVAGKDNMFVLSQSGDLYSSADGLLWQPTGERWIALTGAWLNGVLGLKSTPQGVCHACWPSGLTAETPADAAFPLEGFSNAGYVETEWAAMPVMFVFGGRKADGSLTDAVWAFDGENWANIAATPAIPLEEAMLIPYWLARPTGSLWNYTNRDAWLIMGGKSSEGQSNRQVWYSLDNGVSWMAGGDDLDLPDTLPEFIGADALVELKARSESALSWQKTRVLEPTVEGTTIHWLCPEIYVFGGRDASGNAFSDEVWRGALARFTFTPII